MSEAVALDPAVVGVILAMAVVTYATKAGGLWLVERVDRSDRLEAGLDALPGAVAVAFVAPVLADGGVPEWSAAAATVVVAKRTGNLLASLTVGVAVVLAVRMAV
jgi:uncharacterized membrane protein